MLKAKIVSYVGFAIKSNKVIWGVDKIIESKKRPVLVLKSLDLGRSSNNKLDNHLSKLNINTIEINMEEVVPNKNCKAIGILDNNLANAIIKEFKE